LLTIFYILESVEFFVLITNIPLQKTQAIFILFVVNSDSKKTQSAKYIMFVNVYYSANTQY